MSVKFTFGGVKRELRVELALASKFEEATGLGYLKLYERLYLKEAKTDDVVAVLGVAFAANGINYTSQEIREAFEHDGMIEAYTAAALLVMELLKRPEKSTKGKAEKAANRPNASH